MMLLNRFDPLMLGVFPSDVKFMSISQEMAKRMYKEGMPSYVDDIDEANEFARELESPVCENRTCPQLNPGDKALVGMLSLWGEGRIKIKWMLIKIT